MVKKMISWIKSQYWKWKYRRLAKDVVDCLHGDTSVRELQEIGRLMREVGEKHNLPPWKEMGELIEENAETIVLNRERGIVFPD